MIGAKTRVWSSGVGGASAGIEPEGRLSWSRTGGPHQLELNQYHASAGTELEARVTKTKPHQLESKPSPRQLEFHMGGLYLGGRVKCTNQPIACRSSPAEPPNGWLGGFLIWKAFTQAWQPRLALLADGFLIWQPLLRA